MKTWQAPQLTLSSSVQEIWDLCSRKPFLVYRSSASSARGVAERDCPSCCAWWAVRGQALTVRVTFSEKQSLVTVETG